MCAIPNNEQKGDNIVLVLKLHNYSVSLFDLNQMHAG